MRLHGTHRLAVMARREARPRKTSIKAASVVGRDKPQQTGGHAQDQRNSEHESPTVGAVQAVLSARQAPQLCQLAESPPRGDAWISEINFDGYRLLVFLTGGKVRILSRNALDWTTCLLAHAIAQLRVDTAVLDGELVALKANGLSSFADLQRALRGP